MGFDQHTQTKIQAMHKQKVPILLRNCDIQFNQYSKKLEVIVKGYTKIEVSQTAFDIVNPDEVGAQTIQLTNLQDMPEYTKVNVQVKVIDLKEPQVVGKSKKKQEVTIADQSDNAILTLWEQDIGSLELAQSYSITKLLVRVFNGDHYLSKPAHGSTVQIIDDINNVQEDITDSVEPEIQGASVMAVRELKQYYACEFCKAKIELDDDDHHFGTCSKCSAYVQTKRCTATRFAKLVLTTPSLEATTLVAYNRLLDAIIGDKPLTMRNLMTTKPFDCTYNMYHVVTSVSHLQSAESRGDPAPGGGNPIPGGGGD